MKNNKRIPRRIIWKPIKETDKLYWISNDGRVQSRRYGKVKELILRIVKKNGKGHLRVTIFVKGIKQRHLVHRLVGQYFIPNPNNYPQINHEDGDGFNNWHENLTWGTQQMNMHHAYHILGHKQIHKCDRSGTNNPSHKAKIRRLTLNN